MHIYVVVKRVWVIYDSIDRKVCCDYFYSSWMSFVSDFLQIVKCECVFLTGVKGLFSGYDEFYGHGNNLALVTDSCVTTKQLLKLVSSFFAQDSWDNFTAQCM